MKLLQKTNRTYFIISGSAFLIAGVVFYYVISLFFKDQLNEKLFHDIKHITKSIKNYGTLPYYYPFIEIKEISPKSDKRYHIIDTLISDSFEKRKILYRQVSVVTSINGKEYYIAARDTLIEEDDLLGTITLVTCSVLLLLLISLYLINRKLSLKIWEPFYKTLDKLKEFSHEQPDFNLVSENQPDEFKELNNALEKLTQKVISDYKSLKRFTEDASHEIQTPLAVIQSKLETLMQSPDLKKDQAGLISSAYVYTLRISKLTQTLLLLTKIANDQFPEKKIINFSELLEEKLKILEDHIYEKSLIINKDINTDCKIETNFFLAESLIMNLLGNAVKHSISKGIINIHLDNNRLEISNTGEPLSVPSSMLFVRFYKTNKLSESLGLGLAIVKEICRLNNWEVEYVYDNKNHKLIVTF